MHILTPYRADKDLGKAYNDACALIPKGEWICLMDIDCMFLTPDAPEIIAKYIEMYPETGVFTAFCNRVSRLAGVQMLEGSPSEDDRMRIHIEKAMVQRAVFPSITPILRGEISGYIMVFNQKTWENNRFDEGIGCLAVDTYWSRRIIEQGKQIMRMDAVYVWHTYRIWKEITDKSHLK